MDVSNNKVEEHRSLIIVIKNPKNLEKANN